jgi:hypothetical protein
MPRSRIPVEVVFNPNWWFRNYGISFDESFYFDKERRIENDLTMRRALHERFGIGQPDPAPRPVAGSMHVAGGFVIPALLGVQIRFSGNQAPWPVPREMSREEILALKVPELDTTWPMNRLIAGMDALEEEFGYVVGDFDTDGVLNTALQLRGQQLFLDLIEEPQLAEHLFTVVARTQAQVAAYVTARTGTNSVSTNRSILNVNPKIYLHSNCSVQMISPALYKKSLLSHERYLAESLPPYGIHHCGNNLHLFAGAYSQAPVVFYDVGWGSDVTRCAAAFPGAFLNLRLSPVRMLQEPASEIRRDVQQLLTAAGRTGNLGVCSINMDYGTPDRNVLSIFEAVEVFS